LSFLSILPFWIAHAVAQGVEYIHSGNLPLLSRSQWSRYLDAMNFEEKPAIDLLSDLFPDLSEEELVPLDQALGRYVAIALRVFDDLESRGALTEDAEGRSIESQRSNIKSQLHENS
jgi:hypothetical protein